MPGEPFEDLEELPGETDRTWPPDLLITPHFTLQELALPEGKAARYQLPGAVYPGEWVQTRARPLCEALEAIRAELGRRQGREVPIRILSGYRTEEYNAAIKGAQESQHVQGRAADIYAPGVSAQDLHALILELAPGLPIGGLGEYPTFVHVDVRPRAPGQALARWRG